MANNLAPPPSASATYATLHTTALAFIAAHTLDPTLPSRIDFSRLSALCAPDFEHCWGHKYAVSLSPPLQGTFSFDGFKTHLETMVQMLEAADAVVTDVVVDEVQRKVVLRVSFGMKVRGQEGVENDLVWVLEMEEGGGRVRRSVEFVDGVAAGRLKELMMGARK